MSETNRTDQHIILGAGQLGLAVADALTVGQQPATVVNRSGTLQEQLPPTVSVVQADLDDPDRVESVVRGASVVYLCAAPSYTDWPDKFPPLAQAVAEGVGRTGAKLVFADNLYMYGSTGGQPLQEDLPYAATGAKGRARAQVANILMDAHESGQVEVTIGRASDFFGPRVTGSAFGERVFAAALQDGTVNVLGDVTLPHTYTYVRDFAAALVTLGSHEQAYGEAWHVPNAPAMTTQQWLDMIGEQVGHALKVRSAGEWMVTLLGLFNPPLREMKEMMYEFTEPYVVDDSKYRKAFGGEPTDPAVAIEATLDWYRQQVGA